MFAFGMLTAPLNVIVGVVAVLDDNTTLNVVGVVPVKSPPTVMLPIVRTYGADDAKAIGMLQTVPATPFENASASVSVTLLPESVAAAEPMTAMLASESPEMSFTIVAEAASLEMTTWSPAAGTPEFFHFVMSLQLPLPPSQRQVRPCAGTYR